MLVIFVLLELLMIRKISSTIFEGQRFILKKNFYTIALQEAEMQGFEISKFEFLIFKLERWEGRDCDFFCFCIEVW